MSDKELLKKLVQKAWEFKNPFLPSALSALPIIEEIYSKFDLKNDVFILSKGHASLAHYVILEKYGYTPDYNEKHASRDYKNGLYYSTGSLGHGLPIAVGTAYAKKLRNEKGIVYCLLGDGECMEGTFWESMNLIGELNLENIMVHIDKNFYQGCRKVSETLCANMLIFRKLKWHYTIKGMGIKYLENKTGIHTFKMTENDYAEIMKELQ